MDVLLDLDPQGAKNIKSRFDDSVLIYILPPSLDTLEKRLRTRKTDSDQVIGERIENAIQEIKNALWYDYIIVNQDLEKAVDDAKAIIVAQRKKSKRQAGYLKKFIDPSPL
jgi:guanylate kinase